MIKYLIIIFHLSFLSQAQISDTETLKVHYQLDYVKHVDSDKRSVENLILVTKSDGCTYFMFETMVIIDSIQHSRSLNIADVMRVRSPLYYLIEKNGSKIYHYESFGNDLLKFEEIIIFNWKLVNEQKVIRGYICNKATTNFEGRNWTAWYAADIPSNSGPYKFHGLPGLILDLYDSDNIFHFVVERVELAKFDINPVVSNFFINDGDIVPQLVEKNNFYDFRRKYYSMTLNERIQYINRGEKGTYSLEVTSPIGEQLTSERKPKTKNFIEKYD